MKNIYLLSLLFLVACEDNHSQTKSELKIENADYKVVQLDFNYLNHLENVTPKNEPHYIQSRSLIIIDCTTENYNVDGIVSTRSSIRNEIKAQLEKNKSNEKFPLFVNEEYEQLGEIEHPKNYSLMLLVKPDINFEEYQDIRKEIFMAINDLRNTLSIEKAGKSLFELNKSKEEKDLKIYNEIFRIYPMNYTENVIK